MGAIFSVTVPATSIRSDWRGDPRNTSAPNRDMSWRLSTTAIISMAQQARPNDIGQMELLRAQLMTSSTVVVKTFSGREFSIKPTRHLGCQEFRNGPEGDRSKPAADRGTRRGGCEAAAG